MTLHEYDDRLSLVAARALRQGGEDLLDSVTWRLTTASMLLGCVSRGEAALTPGVVDDIEASFARAEELLQDEQGHV